MNSARTPAMLVGVHEPAPSLMRLTVQEMVMAVRLITKGFGLATNAAGRLEMAA